MDPVNNAAKHIQQTTHLGQPQSVPTGESASITNSEKNIIFQTLNEICGIIKIKYNRAKNKLIALIALPATWCYPKEKLKTATSYKENWVNHNKNITGVKISSAHDAKLDGVEIQKKGATKWVILFQPNAGLYEYGMKEAAEMSEEYNVNVLLFNYRGVNESTGEVITANDLVEDGVAVLSHVKNKGVDPEDIVIYGHSMGGAIGALSLGQEQKEFEKIALIADRTFKSLAQVAENWIGKTAKWFVEGSDWDIDVGGSWEEIKGKKVVTYRKDDQMIKEVVSLKTAERMKTDDTIELESYTSYHKIDPHNEHISTFNNVDAVFQKVGLENTIRLKSGKDEREPEF